MCGVPGELDAAPCQTEQCRRRAAYNEDVSTVIRSVSNFRWKGRGMVNLHPVDARETFGEWRARCLQVEEEEAEDHRDPGQRQVQV